MLWRSHRARARGKGRREQIVPFYFTVVEYEGHVRERDVQNRESVRKTELVRRRERTR